MKADTHAGILRASSIEEQRTRATELWEVEFEPRARGPLASKTVYLASPRMVAYKEQWNPPLCVRGALRSGLVAFALPTEHGLPLHLAGRAAREGRIPWLPDSRLCDVVTEASYENVLLVFDVDFLRETAAKLVHPFAKERIRASAPWMLPADPGKAVALRLRVERLLAGVESRAAGRTAREVRSSRLDEHLAEALLDALVIDDTARGRGEEAGTFTQRSRMAAECQEYARSRNYDVTIAELCDLIGKSRRTLEYVFRDAIGASPARYLQLCRLRRVHRDLVAARPGEASVTELATQWGFLELGRFAGVYRSVFGELPSQTLKRPPRQAASMPALAVSTRAGMSPSEAARPT